MIREKHVIRKIKTNNRRLKARRYHNMQCAKKKQFELMYERIKNRHRRDVKNRDRYKDILNKKA